MRKKLIIGLILFVAGILLEMVSEITDIWLMRFIGGILLPVGMVMGINASFALQQEKQEDGASHKRKKWPAVCATIAAFILFFVVFPFVKVEILSINAEEKLESFDLSRFDNVYCEGTPEVYDCKIFEYRKLDHATVFYVLGDCEFGVMVKLKWNAQDICWEMEDWRNMWTVHGGSASEYYWPPYYIDKMLPFVD